MNPHGIGDLVLVKFVVFWETNTKWYVPNIKDCPYSPDVVGTICEVLDVGGDYVRVKSKYDPYGSWDLPIEAVEAVFTL